MLGEVVHKAAEMFGDRPAVAAARGWTLSYRDLDELSNQVAGGLSRRGLHRGDVLALVMPSTPEYIVAYLAAAKLRMVTTGVNPRLAPEERRRIVDRAEPDRIVATETLSRGLAADWPVDLVEVIATPDAPTRLLGPLRGDAPQSLHPSESADVATIVWTSGTTGNAKGAVFCNSQLAAIAQRDLANQWGNGSAMLASTEFAHVGFMTKLPSYLMSGGTLFLLDRWRPRNALEVTARQGMRTIGGVASQAALMLRDPNFDSYDLSAVEFLIMGGGPSPPALVEEARTRFDAAYSIRYSSTESGGIGTATAFDANDEEALHSVGRPRPGVDLKVVDEDGHTAEPGQVGEVLLRSPTVMTEYYRDREGTGEVLRNGWLHTGDLGFIHGPGLLHLAGRRNDMFVRGGYNVYPEEVEAVLLSHPAVKEAAVIPRVDDVMGSLGVACIAPNDPDSPPKLEDLRQFVGDRLARYKLPEAIRVVNALPLTPGQKVDRRQLRESQ